jgi:predicted ATPase
VTGASGSGKTTLLNAVADALSLAGKPEVVTSVLALRDVGGGFGVPRLSDAVAVATVAARHAKFQPRNGSPIAT